MFLCARSVRFTLPLILTLLSFAPRSTLAGSSSSLLDISTDGKLLACSNRDSGTVSIVDLDKNKKVHEIRVGRHPEGVTFLGDTHKLATAVYDEDIIVFIDADTGKQLGQTEVFDEPYGIVSTSKGDKVYVTLDYPGRIVEINTKTQNVSNEFSVGQHVKGLAISNDDQSLFSTEYYTALVRQTDAKTGKTIDEWEGGSTDNLARQITLHPRRAKAYLPHIRSRITVAHGAGSIFPIVTIVDTKPADGSRRKKIPMDSFQGARVTSNPWDTAITPDGKTFYVYNALDFNIVAYDTDTLQRRATITVTENPHSEEVLLGKRLFYTALQPMSSRLWISCASCHPDGQPDGKTWHNPEGLRNTQSLAGMAWTHPIHWSADRDEVQDFEHTIRGPLMQGRGLVTGRINDSLKAPNKGLSQALDAMAAYSNTHEFTLSPHAKQGLSPAAQRGRELFFSKQTKCATCHSGPFYSDSNPTDKIIRHNVGTAVDNPGELMGPEYDTPTLLGVYRTAPYLSHGKAQTLEEVLTVYNHDDQHGVTSQLSKQERADLIEFLKALPYEDPVPQAEAAGLVKVNK